MSIEIEWERTDRSKESWNITNVLYAYTDVCEDEILYIGKAYGDTTSVGIRFNAPDKEALWRYFNEERGITKVQVLVGDIILEKNERLTKQLIEDIESLLIYEEKPCGNIQNTESRGIRRSGLHVKCSGVWPGESVYVDS